METITGSDAMASSELKVKIKAALAECEAEGKAVPSVREMAEKVGGSAGAVAALMKEIREGVPTLLKVEEIKRDPRCQLRCRQDDETVQSYLAVIQDGGELPPPVVFFDGRTLTYWLADGFHRLAAMILAGLTEVTVLVKEGDLDDAILYAASCNLQNGLRVTNADKKKAVMVLLANSRWKKLSNRKIAEACGVTHPFVAKVKDELSGVVKDKPAPAPKPAPDASDDEGEDEEEGDEGDEGDDEAPAPKPGKGKGDDSGDGEIPEEDMTFEEWCESIPAYSLVSGDARKAVERELRLYWTFAKSLPCEQAAKHARTLLKANANPGDVGPMSGLMRHLVAIPHPRTWKVCRDCNGSGKGSKGTCSKCCGNGFTG
jgi:hypothetical protein